MAAPAGEQEAPAPAPALMADVSPIAWAQFQLRGGWKTFWTTLGGFAAVVGAGMFLFLRLSQGTAEQIWALKTSLTALQAALLVLFICTRISGAIRQDLVGRMLESHRLMPVSPAQAVLGYLVGPAAQPLAMCGANLLLGVGLCYALGLPVPLWLTVNGILLPFAAFAATLAAFGVFAGKPGGSAVGWIGVIIAVMNFAFIGSILPAVNVLITPLLGDTVFALRFAGSDAVVKYAPSAVFQAMIGGVCFAGACRRYRRDDRPALGWDLGLALLAAWVATSLFGIVSWEHVEPSVRRGSGVDPATQFIGSAVVAMLLGLVPLAGAAWSDKDWKGRRAAGDPALGRRPLSPLLVALAGAALTLTLAGGVLFRSGSEAPADVTLRTAAVLMAYFVGAGYLLRITGLVTPKLLAPIFLWLMATWTLPMLADWIRWWLQGAIIGEARGPWTSFGALGALIEIWTGDPKRSTPGVAFQVVFAGAMAIAFYATQRKGSATAQRQLHGDG